MRGKRYGIWTVLRVVDAKPWPWAWLKSDCGHYGRVSVHSLDTFYCGPIAAMAAQWGE
jgi:hypothetical protein